MRGRVTAIVGEQISRAVVLALVLSLLLPPRLVAAASPPDPPDITTPSATNVVPWDVHMEMGAPFHDVDGDRHTATDWEIRAEEDQTVVWAAYNSDQLIHAHLADGRFLGPLAGADRLEFGTVYRFRARYQDSSHAWSDWAERVFETTGDPDVPAWRVRAVAPWPAPTWQTDGGTAVALSDGARLVVESGAGAPLLTIDGGATGLLATVQPELPRPETARLRLIAGPVAEVRLPSSRLTMVAHDGDHAERRTIFLPAVVLAPGAEMVLWVSASGATFYGQVNQITPERDRLARDTILPWQLEPGFRLEAVGAAFHLPTSLAFVPDPGSDPAAPRFYVSELHGRIKVVTNDGRVGTFADDLLNISPAGFPGAGEQGVIGVCVPPDSHDVYATLAHRADSGTLRNKIIRLRSIDGLTASGIDEILAAQPGQGVARPSHQIQQCSFGPDGKLYVFVADGPSYLMAADDGTFNGKVLRLNPDGSAPADNPKYDPTRPTEPISYQFSRRHRNAYGMTWRPSDGHLWLTENGPDVDRLVRIDAGGDYGWDGTNDSMRTNAAYVWPEAHWSPVGLAFAEGAAAEAALPATKQNNLFVASAGAVYGAGPQRAGKTIQEFVMAPGEGIVGPPTTFARYIGEGRGSIVDLRLQPDGFYFTDLFLDEGDGGPNVPGGKIWRIRYTGATAFAPSVVTGAAPLTVSFADTSSLRDAGPPHWDLGNGQMSDAAAPATTYTQPGRYVVSLTRAGADGQLSEALALITVTGADGAVPDVAAAPVELPAAPAPSVLTFPETGMTLGGAFWRYWEANGGLTQFGYPISPEFTDNGRLVQYFERARFERDPARAGGSDEVQLGHIGRETAVARAAEAAFGPAPPPTDGTLYFEATGHTLGDVFRQRWETTGGAAIYGLPISEPVEERWRPGGQLYTVQYFERARLEHHPEMAGVVQEVLLGRLGTGLLARRPAAPP
ncbi:MAG: PQQ-dependent sugar dehydrogenase [Chloroflexi bacterium]|nr:PQQ-dependent sugar dehydrogenase [Chloroflexota bacterium]